MTESIGDRIGRIRRRRAMTQTELARASGLSVGAIRKLECNDRTSARLATLRALAAALGVTTTELMGAGPIQVPVPPPPEPDPASIIAVRQVITPTVGLHLELTGEGEREQQVSLPGVRADLREATHLYQGDDYVAIVAALPGLVADAQALAADDERIDTLGAYAQVLQLTGSVMIHLHRTDLAHAALTKAIEVGKRAGDMLAASAIVSLCWLLLRQRRLAEAERLAIETADHVEPSWRRASDTDLATWGWLMLRASAAAVRDARADDADEMIRAAQAAAVRIGHDIVDYHEYWTSFGPAVVAAKRVEHAMIVGDARGALALAEQVPPTIQTRATSNNRNRMLLDVAAAHVAERQHAEAAEVLLGLRRDAPEWLRQQRYAQDTMRVLAQRRKRGLSRELATLADFLGVEI